MEVTAPHHQPWTPFNRRGIEENGSRFSSHNLRPFLNDELPQISACCILELLLNGGILQHIGLSLVEEREVLEYVHYENSIFEDFFDFACFRAGVYQDPWFPRFFPASTRALGQTLPLRDALRSKIVQIK